MKHYGIAQWVDFARGLLAAEEAAVMRGHSADCEDCRKTAAYWAKLVRVSSEMIPGDVPESVIRKARSIFPDPTSVRQLPRSRAAGPARHPVAV